MDSSRRVDLGADTRNDVGQPVLHVIGGQMHEPNGNQLAGSLWLATVQFTRRH